MTAFNLSAIGKYFSRFWDANFLLQNAAIPLAVLTAYLALFAYFLPDGVNRVFASDLWKPALALTVLSGLAVLGILKLEKGSKLTFKRTSEKLSAYDLILLLLPLTPVVQYILNNQDILSIWESFYVFGIFTLFSAIFILGLPKLLGIFGSTRTLMVLGLAFSFTLLNMPALSQQFAWFEIGSLKIQLAVFGGLFLSIWFLYDLNFKNLLYLVIGVYFLSNTAVQAFTPHENKANAGFTSFKGNKLVQLVGGRKPLSTPNIYLLLYDAYVPNETLLSYGIDNSAQEKYLVERGFKLYPRTYSVAGKSESTMSMVLNSSTGFYGSIRRGVSGGGVVQSLLKSFGYGTYGVFTNDYFFRGTIQKYDFSFPEGRVSSGSSSTRLLSKAVLMGEFQFDLEFDKEPIDNFLSTKRNILSGDFEDPLFLYSHSRFPGHSQNSGKCLPNETELFRERLDFANVEMQQDLEVLIENDPDAIIVVAGDHGPYLTKNCTLTNNRYDISEITRLDIQDRFGTFLAIRWPAEDFEEYDDITVLQDLFPSVFSYLFKDEEMLEAKVAPKTLDLERTSEAYVEDGIIYGGENNGEPLFVE